MQKPPCIKLSNSKQILLCSYFQKSVMFLNNIYITAELNSNLNGISEHVFLYKNYGKFVMTLDFNKLI